MEQSQVAEMGECRTEDRYLQKARRKIEPLYWIAMAQRQHQPAEMAQTRPRTPQDQMSDPRIVILPSSRSAPSGWSVTRY